MSSNTVVEVTDDNYEQIAVIDKKYVVLDFWAQWCAPCITMSVILDELAEHYGNKVIIGKVNIDDNPEVPMKFGVRSIPTLIILKAGNVIATKVGPLTKSEVMAFIDSTI
ncbi:thioredoxin [Thorsellia anophelis]|uniref:Thioredoxin n=1 Tax=Thorsellia anophelis DSM 18579 TaxID=1123402 RepID=A0A1H9ZGP3_9GAMM|nr:thioredoxin [Thorsellia anophelis]SES80768.1 thioredoxin [Thorsellia anophelis DSM 18579]